MLPERGGCLGFMPKKKKKRWTSTWSRSASSLWSCVNRSSRQQASTGGARASTSRNLRLAKLVNGSFQRDKSLIPLRLQKRDRSREIVYAVGIARCLTSWGKRTGAGLDAGQFYFPCSSCTKLVPDIKIASATCKKVKQARPSHVIGQRRWRWSRGPSF